MAARDDWEYNNLVERMRVTEYPMLKGNVYLDHAGTTLPARCLMGRFARDLSSNLYGNPHSASSASSESQNRVDDVRLRLLRFFNADFEDFDLVFTANATAGIKLVAEAFRDREGGFWYGYHKDAHTSLVGVRELARQHNCFESDEAVETWLSSPPGPDLATLFAYPAQSNLNGRRLPLGWCSNLRSRADTSGAQIFSLLDAASYASTSPLELGDARCAPDFTVVSLSKIFGFPDLGALIVRRESGHALLHRKYFGGGTVDMVLCLREQWHAKNTESIHSHLEDGTLAIHSIIAAGHAIDVHRELFRSLDDVAAHTGLLAKKLHADLISLKHANKVRVCEVYAEASADYEDKTTQGPIVAFNIRNSGKAWIANTEVEKLAAIKGISLRTGALCNPGGTASYLGLDPWEMRQNFAAGQRCGLDDEVRGGKPTGMIRLSLGAMSTMNDVTAFMSFMDEFFVEKHVSYDDSDRLETASLSSTALTVESLMVYPIKSCAGWRVPYGKPWSVRREGLAWDREWCLVHCGTGAALSQKQHPRMALIRPRIDLERGVLRVGAVGSVEEVVVPLSADPTQLVDSDKYTARRTRVCGDSILAQVYSSASLADFFTAAVGVPCQLARFPAESQSHLHPGRHSKAHLQLDGSGPPSRVGLGVQQQQQTHPLLLSNESPILVINRSSLNALNEQIKATGGKAARAEVFRANIVVAEHAAAPPGLEQPYAEDEWQSLRIGGQLFRLLGGCRRCQMVCVDQETGVKDHEPFATLAKTRRVKGKVVFGSHACHVPAATDDHGDGRAVTLADQNPTVMVGDEVVAAWRDADGVVAPA